MGKIVMIDVNEAAFPALQRFITEYGLHYDLFIKEEIPQPKTQPAQAPQAEVQPSQAQPAQTPVPEKTLVVKTKECGSTILFSTTVSLLQSYGNSVSFYYYASKDLNKMLKLISGKNIKNYEVWAAEAGFFRSHRSYIVNLNYVLLNPAKRCFVLTINGNPKEIPIARNVWRDHNVRLLNLPFLKQVPPQAA